MNKRNFNIQIISVKVVLGEVYFLKYNNQYVS